MAASASATLAGLATTALVAWPDRNLTTSIIVKASSWHCRVGYFFYCFEPLRTAANNAPGWDWWCYLGNGVESLVLLVNFTVAYLLLRAALCDRPWLAGHLVPPIAAAAPAPGATRMRPLIYVYDPPAWAAARMMQYRDAK
jgi:hypothetical protein